MKNLAMIVLGMLALGGCSSNAPKETKNADQPKVYSMEDVNQELRQGGVQNGSTREVVQTFFKAHPAYQVCKEFEGGLIAVLRNKRADPKADDQYVVVAYNDGKVDYLDIGPAQFSAGNVASYCR